jgi:hypothetical protein
MNDMWEESESEDEYQQNEEMPIDIDINFKNNVLNIKHLLYENIVLSPELGTEKAQNLETLQEYLKNINEVYILCLNAQKGIINDEKIKKFPENVREPLKRILSWLNDYFRKNNIPDTIPYDNFINKSFKEYQFVQDNSFE